MKSYIRFEVAERKPKTNVYNVVSKSEGAILGRIFWRWAWRQYIFEPVSDTIWSKGCMEEVQQFLTKLMDEKKVKK